MVQIPMGAEDTFTGIIDLFEMEAYTYNDDKGDNITIGEIPDQYKEDAELYRAEMIEKICDLDEDLMMMYLEGEEPSAEEMKAALRKATCECRAVPVVCGSAYKNKGIQKSLHRLTSPQLRALIWTETRSRDILLMKSLSQRSRSRS